MRIKRRLSGIEICWPGDSPIFTGEDPLNIDHAAKLSTIIYGDPTGALARWQLGCDRIVCNSNNMQSPRNCRIGEDARAGVDDILVPGHAVRAGYIARRKIHRGLAIPVRTISAPDLKRPGPASWHPELVAIGVFTYEGQRTGDFPRAINVIPKNADCPRLKHCRAGQITLYYKQYY